MLTQIFMEPDTFADSLQNGRVTVLIMSINVGLPILPIYFVDSKRWVIVVATHKKFRLLFLMSDIKVSICDYVESSSIYLFTGVEFNS